MDSSDLCRHQMAFVQNTLRTLSAHFTPNPSWSVYANLAPPRHSGRTGTSSSSSTTTPSGRHGPQALSVLVPSTSSVNFLIVELLLLSKSFVWVLHAELIAGLLRLSKNLLFLVILALCSCRSSAVVVYFSSSRVHLPRSPAVLIPFFVDLAAAFNKVFCLVFYKFEEFVDVIFPSFYWSPNRSVGPVF